MGGGGIPVGHQQLLHMEGGIGCEEAEAAPAAGDPTATGDVDNVNAEFN